MRLGKYSVAHALVQGRADDRREQLPRGGIRQSADPQLGQPGQLLKPAWLALCEQKDDGLGGQATGHERQHLAEDRSSHWTSSTRQTQRMLLRRVREQAEHGEPDEESIGLRARAQAERGRQRVALWRRQPLPTVQQSHAQLMQAGERELHLPLRPNRAQDPAALGAVRGVIQQGRFSYSRLAAQHQHAAPPRVRFCQQLIERRTLGPAAGQPGAHVPSRRNGHPNRQHNVGAVGRSH